MTGERLIAGHYRLLERLGSGSMGEVWRALDVQVEREVALKSLRPELAANAAFVDRFKTEAVVLARLHHPHIASLYTLAREGEALYMVMELVPGATLAGLLQQGGPMPWPRVRGFGLQALRALAHAHESGVVHRDVKPANMLVTPGGVLKLTDFGIARVNQRARMTRAGNWVGTMEYASPEQVRGEAVDGRSDLYALAIVLYELLTGELPFMADTDFQLMKAQLEQAPPCAGQRVPGLPTAFEAALLKAMAKEPGARFADAAAFAAALEALDVEEGLATSAQRGASASAWAMPGRWLTWAQGLQRWWASTSMITALQHTLRRAPGGAAWLRWGRGNPILAAAVGVALLAAGLFVAAMRPAPATAPSAQLGVGSPAWAQGVWPREPSGAPGALGAGVPGASLLPMALPPGDRAASAAAPDEPPSDPPRPPPQEPVQPPPPARKPNPTKPAPGPAPDTPRATPPQKPAAPQKPPEPRPAEPGWYIRR